ncbi:MAG: rod shape-determining protein MreC [Anaerolineae bacterium]|nr:rod shape-determining protein MreC [Anaerolineae bacterium]
MGREGRPWLPYMMLALAIGILALFETGTLEPVENALAYVVAPVERGLASVFERVSSLSQTVRDVQELQQRVAELEEANNALQVENIRLREFEAENQQLRERLNFANENPTYSLVGADVVERGCEIYPCAQVIGQDTIPYLRYLIINAGSNDGVAIGMPVVTGGSALIGRVVQETPNMAYIQLINNPGSQISAMVQQSQITGLVIGDEEGNLRMTEILPDEEVNEGEIVITSGLGGLMPRGLILGQIASVEYQESDLFQEAILRPVMNFRYLDMVLIINDFPRTALLEEFEAQ